MVLLLSCIVGIVLGRVLPNPVTGHEFRVRSTDKDLEKRSNLYQQRYLVRFVKW